MDYAVDHFRYAIIRTNFKYGIYFDYYYYWSGFGKSIQLIQRDWARVLPPIIAFGGI